MKQFFHNTHTVTKTVKTPISVEELKNLLETHKPSELWHDDWFSKIPFGHMTDYKPDGSFMFSCTPSADKTPQKYNAEILYKFLKYQGFENCYFNI